MNRVVFASITALLACGVRPASVLAQGNDPRAAVQSAYVAGDSERARRLLEPLLSAHPDDPDLLRRLALIEAAEHNLDAAQTTIDRAIALAPHDADIRLARATILLWRGDISSASREANILGQSHPGYPGLAEIRARIASASAARRLRLVSASLGATVSRASFSAGPEQTWTVQRASTSFGWGDGNVATFEANREARVAVDTRLAARVDLPVGKTRLFFGGAATPHADFRETWSLEAGAETPLAGPATLLVDGRFAAYRNVDVGTAGVGLRFGLGKRTSLTARTINLFGGGDSYRFGASLRLDYQQSNRTLLYAIAASYPDSETDGTRQLDSIAGGARVSLGHNWSLGLTGEYEDRRNSYSRTGASVDLIWMFGQ